MSALAAPSIRTAPAAFPGVDRSLSGGRRILDHVGGEEVALAVGRYDDLRGLGVVLDLAPQAADQDVDGPVGGVPVPVGHLGEEAFAGHSLVRP